MVNDKPKKVLWLSSLLFKMLLSKSWSIMAHLPRFQMTIKYNLSKQKPYCTLSFVESTIKQAAEKIESSNSLGFNCSIFFASGPQRILPQRVRIRSGVQLLQGLHHRGRDVLGRRTSRNKSNQSPEAAFDAQLARIIFA